MHTTCGSLRVDSIQPFHFELTLPQPRFYTIPERLGLGPNLCLMSVTGEFHRASTHLEISIGQESLEILLLGNTQL